MASQVPEFEYDIFISYRHNDNRSGWVTDFVNSLKEELATIIKEPVSVYFDSNLYDGLLETHNVDKSLEGKLKSLVFIPVLSQIYCDTKSFAWQHEFCAFNRLSLQDTPSRDIPLRNGNVSSRILPIVIHNLDQEDTSLLESELGTKLRSIDFTFRAPGVNRPLRKDDKRSENINNLSYHDQLNKLANAVKEIIAAIKNPGRTSEASEIITSKAEIPSDRTLAVLPFANLSQDPTQEYFSDGITENILMQLASLPEFRVISRTSVMRYKKTLKSAQEIAAELGVMYLLEGSAQAHKDKVRISVQLINAPEDKPVWSKVFVESLDDIFTIQSTVAEVVAKELHASLNPKQSEKLHEVPTKNPQAYDLFLKGRHAYNQWSVEGYKAATDFFSKAVALDPDFKEAYSYLASSYSARMSWNGDLSPDEAEKQITPNLEKVWKLGPTDNDYVTQSFVAFFIRKDFAAAEQALLQAISLNSNNALALFSYGYLLNITGRFNEALDVLEAAQKIEPLTVGYFNHLVISYYLSGKSEDARATVTEALQLYPSVVRLYDLSARIHLRQQNFQQAIDEALKGLQASRVRPPSMVAWLVHGYARINNNGKSTEYLNELLARSAANEKGINIYLVYAYHGLGNDAEAQVWLARARATNDVDLIWLNVDPLLIGLNVTGSSPDFEAAKESIFKLLDMMPDLPYHNRTHVLDVHQAALSIAETENVTDEEHELLQLAAWLHDVGFIHGAKNHEEKGAEIAGELLPKFFYTPQHVQIIQNMILATKLPQSPSTLLERILCDADLDYLGRADFLRISKTLFEEMLAGGAVETEREWNLVQRTFLQSHKYHTPFSQKNREPNKQQRIQEIVAGLKR